MKAVKRRRRKLATTSMKVTPKTVRFGPTVHAEKSSFVTSVHTFGNRLRSALRKVGSGLMNTMRVIFRRQSIHPTVSVTDFLELSSGSTDSSPSTSLLGRYDYGGSEVGSLLQLSGFKSVLPELTQTIVQLPHEVRYRIYSYLSPMDILNLRQVNKTISNDVNQVKGLRLKVNNYVANYDWIKDVSLEGITVDYWLEEITPKSVWLSRNALVRLKRLHLRGTISPENFQAILKAASYLEHLEIEFTQFNISLQPELFMGALTIPHNLCELKLTARINSHVDARLSLRNLTSLLLQIRRCQNLHVLSVDFLFIVDTNEMDEFHILFIKFIRSYAPFLKKVDVAFKLILQQTPLLSRQSIASVVDYQSWTHLLQLQQLNMSLDKIYVDWWEPLLLSQRKLKVLDLNLKGRFWTSMPGIIKQSQGSLERISLSSVNLPKESVGGGLNIIPLDLNCFKACLKLTDLSITHLESNPLTITPYVKGTQDLPSSLKSLGMKYLVLKPHQQLALLVKLPLLDKLMLSHWTESDESFGSFLIILAFLVLFGQTSIQSFELVETKRKVEHKHEEVNKLIEALHSKADIQQYETLTEGSLKITIKPKV